jgi:hypothetical protein
LRTRALSPQANRYSGAGLGRFHMPSARKTIRRYKLVPERGRREVLDEVGRSPPLAGNRTRVTFLLDVDPSVSVPAFLVDPRLREIGRAGR